MSSLNQVRMLHIDGYQKVTVRNQEYFDHTKSSIERNRCAVIAPA